MLGMTAGAARQPWARRCSRSGNGSVGAMWIGTAAGGGGGGAGRGVAADELAGRAWSELPDGAQANAGAPLWSRLFEL